MLSIAGCGGSGGADDSGGRRIRAAVCPTSPPNCYQEGRAYVGIDVEIFRMFCEERGYTLDITAYDWAGMLGAVIANRADVAFSGISITEKRQEIMSFSSPYMVNVLVIAALADRNVVMNSTDDWNNYRLGFVRGMYFGDLFKTKYKDKYAYADLKQYPSYNELLADLGNGNVDGALMDSLVLADQRQKKIYDVTVAFTLEEDDRFGYAFPMNSPLRDEFEAFLNARNVEVQSIIDRYMKAGS